MMALQQYSSFMECSQHWLHSVISKKTKRMCTCFFMCGISLSVAICIFTTSSDFEWKTIETHFANIDSVKNFFLAFVVLVSFVDICLSITVLVLQFLKIICVMQQGHGLHELLTKRFDLFGNEDSLQSNRNGIKYSSESGSMFPKLKVTESDPNSYWWWKEWKIQRLVPIINVKLHFL